MLITRQSVKIVIIEKRIINIKYRKRSSEMSKNIRTEAVDHLFEAILCLKDKEECYTFFEDVCTINELLSLSQRFEVAKMLMPLNAPDQADFFKDQCSGTRLPRAAACFYYTMPCPELNINLSKFI